MQLVCSTWEERSWFSEKIWFDRLSGAGLLCFRKMDNFVAGVDFFFFIDSFPVQHHDVFGSLRDTERVNYFRSVTGNY